MTPEEKEIANKIGLFYLKKNDGDYKKAEQEIISLGITSLTIDTRLYGDGKICIALSRPGYLIGKRGVVIDALKDYLQMGIHVKEDDLLAELIPTDYHNLMGDDY